MPVGTLLVNSGPGHMPVKFPINLLRLALTLAAKSANMGDQQPEGTI